MDQKESKGDHIEDLGILALKMTWVHSAVNLKMINDSKYCRIEYLFFP